MPNHAESPIFLLLTNPSWGNTPAYDSVLAGLREDWQFHPSETHDDIPLLARLIHRWQVDGQEEAKLIPIVASLLRRGADAPPVLAALDTINDVSPSAPLPFHWQRCSGVRFLLQQAALGCNLDEAELGANLLSLPTFGLGVKESMTKVGGWLSAHAGWKTTINGMNVVAWLSLNAITDAELLGFSQSCRPTTETGLHGLRVVRQLAASALSSGQLGVFDRFLAGCGLLALGSKRGYGGAEADVRTSLDKVARKVLDLNQDEGWMGLVEQAKTDPSISPEDRLRIGTALLSGLLPMMEGHDDAWELFPACLPLVYDNGQCKADISAFSLVLDRSRHLPSEKFWKDLPVCPMHHDALLRVFVGGDRNHNSIGAAEEYQQFLLALEEWSDPARVGPFDAMMYRNMGPPATGQRIALHTSLEQYAKRHAVACEAAQLDQITPPAHSLPSRRF